MSIVDDSVVRPAAMTPAAIRFRSLTLPVFAASLFLSAFLLFAVQPMFTKMVLPKLGGSPGVWSVAMVFFQTALLAGYAYAHLLARRLTPRNAALAHVGLMVAVLFVALPIGLATNYGRPPVEGQAIWLMGLFAVSVGLPFFAVSANGPLLQAWFARSGHPHAKDPYFLYGASNIGSLLALLSYPSLVEPNATLSEQSWLWTVGFAGLIAAIALCASYVAAVSKAVTADAPGDADLSADPIAWGRRFAWVGLAFVPSGLLVAVTAYISTDVAAAPFLWVVPLSLFLLTFIITFQRKPILSHAMMLRVQPVFIALPAVSLVGNFSFGWGFTIALHLEAFFVTAMVCHGELVRRRPPASQLTDFYLAMSLGGVLGGLFAGLLAPMMFNWIAEYPILIIAGLFCRPGLWNGSDRRREMIELACILGLAALITVPDFAFGMVPNASVATFRSSVLLVLAVVIAVLGNRPMRLIGLTVMAMTLSGLYGLPSHSEASVRSFFGVHKTVITADGQFRQLLHGTTLHGAMRVRTEQGAPIDGPPRPTTYYFRDSAMVQPIFALREARGHLDKIAVVGVGSGSLACHRAVGEKWTFYEIDADVIRIARDPTKFRFFSSCAPDAEFVVGDARLTLADAPDASLDVLVLDAFSSDSIPAHLLTKEAMALYFRKLAPHGVAIVHVSNRNMELASVVTSVATDQGLVAWSRDQKKDLHQDVDIDPTVVVVARSAADLGPLTTAANWKPQPVDASVSPWTDDYANVFGAIWREYTQ